MNSTFRAIAIAAILLASPCLAQTPKHATSSGAPSGFAPEMAPVMVPATSAPLTWAVATKTTLGPFQPQLNRPIFLTKSSTDTAAISVTITTDGNCAHGVVPTALIGTNESGQWGPTAWSFRAHLGIETQAAAGWCVTITPATNGTNSAGSLGQ